MTPEAIASSTSRSDQHGTILRSIHVELRRGVALERSGSRWTLSVDGRDIEFRLPHGSAWRALEALQQGRCLLVDLDGSREEGPRTITARTELQKLWERGWLTQVLSHEHRALATLYNFGDLPLFPSTPSHTAPLCLSEDALMRRTGTSLIVESTARGAFLECLDTQLCPLLGLLVRPASLDALTCAVSLPSHIVATAVSWLIAIGAVVPGDRPMPFAAWSFSDRLLHARSRRGRHIGGYGATFAWRETVGEPPAIRPRASDRTIQLAKPNLDEVTKEDPPFTAVLERRRSVREHSEIPLSCRELAEFLYRVARVTAVTQAGPYTAALRPYPSGGGLHELELYPLVNRCADVPPALYRYNGFEHALEHVSDHTRDTKQLVIEAKQSCGIPGEPHVLVLIAARFRRVGWKYESIAYALTLKNVGVLYQTMYLVATAMGLGPCAVGGGDADRFGRVTGLDYWEESVVGEFMLGRPAARHT